MFVVACCFDACYGISFLFSTRCTYDVIISWCLNPLFSFILSFFDILLRYVTHMDMIYLLFDSYMLLSDCSIQFLLFQLSPLGYGLLSL
jgi:hypothetical protein